MIWSGLSKPAAARALNVPIGALSKWDIPSLSPLVKYPARVKKAVVAMTWQGIMYVGIARQFGVPERTVGRWTSGIRSGRRRYSGRYFLVLTELLNNSCYEAEEE